jgi:O-antigen/teichoic acid export membrane protein
MSGVAWKATSTTFLQLSRFIVSVVLARMLAPHDWGLAAMVAVFSGVIVLFSDSALGSALIQRRSLTDADKSTVFWTSTVVGVALTGAGIALAGPLADFYGEPSVRPLFEAASLGFVIGCIGTTQTALLVRGLNFRSLELRQMAATFVGAVVGISLAASGFGAWAIVLQQLAASVTATLLVWKLSGWRPSFTFSVASLRSLSAFTGNVFGQNLLYAAGRTVDKLIIGRYLGAASLGTYTLASNVILAPFNQVAAPLQQVLFPAMSQIQDDKRRLAEVWIRVTRLVGAVSIPALIGLILVAPDFVSVVLGTQWKGAVPVIQILAVVGVMQSLQTLNGEILLALGRSGALLLFTVLWFVSSLTAVIVGVRWGMIGVAVCYAVASIVIEPVNAWMTARALRMSVWEFFRSLSGVVAAAVAMGLAVGVARWTLVALGTPALVRLIGMIMLGMAIFATCLPRCAPEVVDEVRGMISRRRHRSVERRPEPALSAR